MLYQSRRHELGCPKRLVCKADAAKRPCGPERGCKHFVGPEEGMPDPGHVRWVSFLVRVESLLNMGVAIALNDLPPGTWTDLFALALERQRMDRILDRAKERKERIEKGGVADIPGVDRKALERVRVENKVPPVGGTIFPQTRPMR